MNDPSANGRRFPVSGRESWMVSRSRRVAAPRVAAALCKRDTSECLASIGVESSETGSHG